jgi:hypothetical protein
VAEFAFERRQGIGPGKTRECFGESREADGAPALERQEAEVLREGSFPKAARTSQEHVVTVLEEVEVQELLEEITVDLSRMVPVEPIEWFETSQSCEARPDGEVSSLALLAFERDELLGELDVREAALAGVGEECGEGLGGAPKADGSECFEEISLRCRHRSSPGCEG